MPGTSTSSGTLTISATNTGSSGNVYLDDFSLSDPIGPGGGQQFGYDGFGNLLSQSAIFGSSPFISLTVNPNTNQVTGTGVVFDAAGNMTQDGGVSYGYDSMNRLTSAGTASYSYSPGENKRMVVYSNISPTPQLNMYLYGPNGKVLSKFLFEPSGSQWDAVPGSQTYYFYLGGKALNWAENAENNVGSNAASQFWPYGQGSGVFATYQPDPSGFLYANRRYYNPIWGRFNTADLSNRKRGGLRGSLAWNKYSYSVGDPIKRNDPSGKCDVAAGGFQMNSDDSQDYTNAFPGWMIDYPFSNSTSGSWLGNVLTGIGDLSSPYSQAALGTAITEAYYEQPGNYIHLVLTSGSAGLLASIWSQLPSQVQNAVSSIVYLIPGGNPAGSALPCPTNPIFKK